MRSRLPRGTTDPQTPMTHLIIYYLFLLLFLLQQKDNN